jgi:hypothetical protein
MLAAFEYDVATPSPIAAIRPSMGVEFRPHEMPASGSAVAAATVNPDLVYKI